MQIRASVVGRRSFGSFSPLVLASLLAIAVQLFGSAVVAQPTLRVASGAGAPGETVDLDVSLMSPSGAVAAQLDLLFDPAVLSTGVLTAGPGLQDHVLDWATVGPGRLRVIVNSLTRAGLDPDVLFTVPFVVSSSAASGDQTIGLDAVLLADGSAASVGPGSLLAGSVLVSGIGAPTGVPTLDVWATGFLVVLLALTALVFLRSGSGAAGVIVLIVASTVLLKLGPEPLYAQTMPGDANGDGVIAPIDVLVIINQILGRSMATGDPDCNVDSQVDVLDAVCVVQALSTGPQS